MQWQWMSAASRWFAAAAACMCILTTLAACSLDPEPEEAQAIPKIAGGSDLWPRLLEQIPYPYTTPLPPEEATLIDGVYSKVDPREGARPFCRRCMPYPAEGGLWLLQMDRGVYRILSAASLNGWRSLGSFTLSGDRLELFNDPHCMNVTGTYSWKLEKGQLFLEVLRDECARDWRGITFSKQPWDRGMATGD